MSNPKTAKTIETWLVVWSSRKTQPVDGTFGVNGRRESTLISPKISPPLLSCPSFHPSQGTRKDLSHHESHHRSLLLLLLTASGRADMITFTFAEEGADLRVSWLGAVEEEELESEDE